MLVNSDLEGAEPLASPPFVVPGEVFYRSKFLRSNSYKRNIKANRIVVSEFGTMSYPDPCSNIFSR